MTLNETVSSFVKAINKITLQEPILSRSTYHRASNKQGVSIVFKSSRSRGTVWLQLYQTNTIRDHSTVGTYYSIQTKVQWLT